MKIIGFLEGIRKRPLMYLAEAKLSLLEALITGIVIAERNHEDSVLDIDIGKFEIWITKKLKKKGNIKSFVFALEMCNNDDKEAFYLWLDWAEGFRNDTK